MRPTRIRTFPFAPPPPGYARYAQVDIEAVFKAGRTPYQGPVTLAARDVLYLHRNAFPHLFEYVKFDELGVGEVVDWLERQYGRQMWHDRNSEGDNERARWWMINDFLITFRSYVDATEFKMRWG